MSIQHSHTKIDKIADLQWKHRVVVGIVKSEEAMKSALNALKAHQEDISDRKIAYFITDGQHHHTNYQGTLDKKIWEDVARILNKSDDNYALIGLDGGVKARYEKLEVAEIFALIDTMPMRQQEMRENQ